MNIVDCLDDTIILRFLVGKLAGHAREQAEFHFDRCGGCRDVLAQLAAITTLPPLSSVADVSAELSGTPPALLGGRYVLHELLGQGGMGQVFRATDQLTGQDVALKRMILSTENGSAAIARSDRLASLAQEFSILASLRHPHIIAVLDYGFDPERRPFYTMEWLPNSYPLLPIAQGLPPETQVTLLLQVLEALLYLHRHGILHRDLKPSNLLYLMTTEGPRVRVLDFGLASTEGEGPQQGLVGTPPYMAPELFLGQPASEASDLYAIGVLAYELLTGKLPVRVEDAGMGALPAFVQRLLTTQVDFTLAPAPFQRVLDRALHKSPALRYRDAAVFHAELAAAAGLNRNRVSVAGPGTPLGAPRFTGRETELDLLRNALTELRSGHGSAWLVCGESGIGKSRLLDELRKQALVAGAQVLRGQSVVRGGAPYHLWFDVVRLLLLRLAPTDDARMILGELLPEVRVPATHQPDAQAEAVPEPTLPAASEHTLQLVHLRLRQALRELLRRVPSPLVLLLEDLQWADEASLALLEELQSDPASLRHLIVATVREREVPTLPHRLRGMRPLLLSRLSPPQMSALSASLLGPVGQDPRLLELLVRETEGNTFLMVEVFRALTQAAGPPSALTVQKLSDDLLMGGARQVLRLRLARAPEHCQPLLRLAAVQGRILDPLILVREDPLLEQSLSACVEAGVLEVHEQRHRFSHDRLREQLLQDIPADLRTGLHARIARHLQTVYPDSPVYAAQLAYHLHRAGLLDEAARAYLRAAEDALRRGAAPAAERAFEQALQYLPRGALLERAKCLRGLTLASFRLGRLSQAEQALRKLSTLAGEPIPSNWQGMAKTAFRQAAGLLQQRGLWPAPLLKKATEQQAPLREELYQALSVHEVYIWLGRPELSLFTSLLGLRLEQTHRSEDRWSDYRLALAFLLSYTPLGPLSLRALDAAASPTDRKAAAQTRRVQAILWLNRGRWESALREAHEAVAQARTLSDVQVLLESLLALQLAATNQDEFGLAETVSREMERLAWTADNRLYRALGLTGLAAAQQRRGALTECEQTLQQVWALGPELGPQIGSLSHALGAICALRSGNPKQAEKRALRALRATEQLSLPAPELRHVFDCIVDVFLSLGTNDRAVDVVLRRLRVLMVQFPFARQLWHFVRGRQALRQGQMVRAKKELWRAVQSAVQSRDRYTEARAHAFLGQILGEEEQTPDGVSASTHLATANAIFLQLGATWELTGLQKKNRAVSPG